MFFTYRIFAIPNTIDIIKLSTSYKIEVSSRRRGLPKGHYQISRKYCEFEWLHLELQYHFPGVIIPVLPQDESVFDFGNAQVLLSNRMKYMESYLNMVGSHPELGVSLTFLTFMDANELRLAQGIEESKKNRNLNPNTSNINNSNSWQKGVDYSISKVELFEPVFVYS